MLLGRLGVPLSEADRMSFREIFNAIQGFTELKRQEHAAMFNMLQFNAFHTAMSKGQQQAIKRARNPYWEREIKTGKPLTMEDVSPLFSSLSKRKN